MVLIRVLVLRRNKNKIDTLNLLRIRLYKEIEVILNGLNKEVRYKNMQPKLNIGWNWLT